MVLALLITSEFRILVFSPTSRPIYPFSIPFYAVVNLISASLENLSPLTKSTGK